MGGPDAPRSVSGTDARLRAALGAVLVPGTAPGSTAGPIVVGMARQGYNPQFRQWRINSLPVERPSRWHGPGARTVASGAASGVERAHKSVDVTASLVACKTGLRSCSGRPHLPQVPLDVTPGERVKCTTATRIPTVVSAVFTRYKIGEAL